MAFLSKSSVSTNVTPISEVRIFGRLCHTSQSTHTMSVSAKNGKAASKPTIASEMKNWFKNAMPYLRIYYAKGLSLA